jgi:general stress protein YciG
MAAGRARLAAIALRGALVESGAADGGEGHDSGQDREKLREASLEGGDHSHDSTSALEQGCDRHPVGFSMAALVVVAGRPR